ncbi:hypothetical protein DFH09DRAFT_1074560 [Mycena vulgaris]|nr:hypothetical protein DFH09DRAFT_1074560 [Mycena vulgaris]
MRPFALPAFSFLACILAGTSTVNVPRLSQNHSQNPTPTTSIDGLPAPTSTASAIVVAYDIAVQLCGPDVDAATQKALQAYNLEVMPIQNATSATDPGFLAWFRNYPPLVAANANCSGGSGDDVLCYAETNYTIDMLPISGAMGATTTSGDGDASHSTSSLPGHGVIFRPQPIAFLAGLCGLYTLPLSRLTVKSFHGGTVINDGSGVHFQASPADRRVGNRTGLPPLVFQLLSSAAATKASTSAVDLGTKVMAPPACGPLPSPLFPPGSAPVVAEDELVLVADGDFVGDVADAVSGMKVARSRLYVLSKSSEPISRLVRFD